MKKLLLTASLLTVLASCKPSLTPTQISDEVASINDSLKTLGNKWGEEFGKSYMSQDYSGLKPIRENISTFITLKIGELSDTKDAGGSKEFRDGELEFLKYEKEMLDKAFVAFETFNANTSTTDLVSASDVLTRYSNGEGAIIEKLRAVQRAFAEKNHITLIKER